MNVKFRFIVIRFETADTYYLLAENTRSKFYRESLKPAIEKYVNVVAV
jgi:hypothetical protein